MQDRILAEIKQHPAVAHARLWGGRICIDVRGTLSCPGEQSTRVWLRDQQLVIQRGEGSTSPVWEANLARLCDWLRSKGVSALMQPLRIVETD
jgi:hypothetical protein